MVHMALVDEIVGMPVVRADEEARGRARPDGPDEVPQVAGGGPLPQHDVHALGQLFEGLGYARALVVRADAGGDVGRELAARKPGSVAVDRLGDVSEQGDLVEELLVLVKDAGVVHHFAEAEDPRLSEEGMHVGGVEGRPCRVEIGGRHAGGHHEVHVDGQAFARGEHVAHALVAEDVGYLVGVRDDCRRAPRGDDARVLGRREEGGLDVHVGVDEAGGEVPPLEVDDLLGPKAVVHAGHEALADGDRGVLPYFPAQEVYEGAVGQVEVAGDGAARGVYKVLAYGHAKAAFRINSRR